MANTYGLLDDNLIVCMTAGFLFLLLFGVVCLIWIIRLKKHVNLLKEGIRQISTGQYSYRFHLHDERQFMDIFHQFNQMAETVENMVEQMDKITLQRAELEVQSLQAQINPHFLYNTLSSISRLAKLGEVDNLHAMLLALAKFYRLTLNEGKPEYYLEQEIQHVRSYMEIQQIKYRELVTFSYQVEEELLRYLTLRMILQPFAENAIKHAFVGEPMHIRLEVYEQGTSIIFQMMDNGVGMPKERLATIYTEGEGKGIGIVNVHNRIKLHYGEEYGIQITSDLGIGTTVKISIPKTLESKHK